MHRHAWRLEGVLEGADTTVGIWRSVRESKKCVKAWNNNIWGGGGSRIHLCERNWWVHAEMCEGDGMMEAGRDTAGVDFVWGWKLGSRGFLNVGKVKQANFGSRLCIRILYGSIIYGSITYMGQLYMGQLYMGQLYIWVNYLCRTLTCRCPAEHSCLLAMPYYILSITLDVRGEKCVWNKRRREGESVCIVKSWVISKIESSVVRPNSSCF